MELSEIVRKRDQLVSQEKEFKKDVDKINLGDFIEKRLRTTFIGALATFESKFGKLWGHNQFKITDQQKQFRQVWQEARKEILDRGNDYIKEIKKELDANEVNRVGYHYDFDIGQPDFSGTMFHMND